MNFLKSEIYFRKNTSQRNKDNISSILGVTNCLGTGNSFGMAYMSRKKNAIFN